MTAGCRTGNGDGVQAAFYDEPRVLTVSIYQSPLSLFPARFPDRLRGRSGERHAVNIEVPAGTGDASWLRAFHAVVPGVVRAFRPDVLVTQHGTDTHREDPLSDLNLSIDGQHTSYEALRRLADGRWLALGGGGGTARCGWYPGRGPTCSRSCPATTSTRPPSAQAWLQRAAAASPDTPLPIDIPDGTTHPVPFRRWDGCVELPIDRVIQDTRSVVYPLHGLDPFGPRD